MTETPRTADELLVTQLLVGAGAGNAEALNAVFPLVYGELRALARRRLQAESPGHTLGTTALVHEAYLKLAAQTRVEWRGPEHFYAIASRIMRRILINHAVAKQTQKRGGNSVTQSIDDVVFAMTDDEADELIALDEALDRLKVFNPRGADVIVQRFFGGLTHEEIAEGLGTSTITVRRAWTTARTWLRRELTGRGIP
jgi:RNA polymerase sigma factor (TIGR02999 family)